MKSGNIKEATVQVLLSTHNGSQYLPELERIMQVYYAHKPPELIQAEQNLIPDNRFTEKDLILITYGDILSSESSCPLATLANFLAQVPQDI